MRSRGPKVMRDVYRDLRDRRLLSIAIVLVLAIIAVPFLVKGDGGGAPADSATVSVAGLKGSEALDSVVVAETPQLRNFRRRLDRFRSRNPFEQQLTGGTEASVGGPATASDEDATESGSVEVAADPASTGDIPVDDGSVSESEPVEPVEPEQPVEGEEVPGTVLYTTRIDVRVGPVGETRVIEDVEELDYLPDSDTPVAEYLYSGVDLKSAAFVVSPAAIATEGDGRCEPNPAACQFLLLDIGEEQFFDYDGLTYRLQLLDVNLHEQPLDGELTPEDVKRTGGYTAGRSLDDLTSP